MIIMCCILKQFQYWLFKLFKTKRLRATGWYMPGFLKLLLSMKLVACVHVCARPRGYY